MNSKKVNFNAIRDIQHEIGVLINYGGTAYESDEAKQRCITESALRLEQAIVSVLEQAGVKIIANPAGETKESRYRYCQVRV